MARRTGSMQSFCEVVSCAILPQRIVSQPSGRPFRQLRLNLPIPPRPGTSRRRQSTGVLKGVFTVAQTKSTSAAQPSYIPTAKELVREARKLVPVLRERAQATDELRTLPDETVADLKAAGIHKIFTPRRYGGFEMDWGAHVDRVPRTRPRLRLHVLGGVRGDVAHPGCWAASRCAPRRNSGRTIRTPSSPPPLPAAERWSRWTAASC